LRRKVDNTVNAHWKGAAEMVLKTCSTYYDASGIVKDLDNDNMLKFEYIIQVCFFWVDAIGCNLPFGSRLKWGELVIVLRKLFIRLLYCMILWSLT